MNGFGFCCCMPPCMPTVRGDCSWSHNHQSGAFECLSGSLPDGVTGVNIPLDPSCFFFGEAYPTPNVAGGYTSTVDVNGGSLTLVQDAGNEQGSLQGLPKVQARSIPFDYRYDRSVEISFKLDEQGIYLAGSLGDVAWPHGNHHHIRNSFEVGGYYLEVDDKSIRKTHPAIGAISAAGNMNGTGYPNGAIFGMGGDPIHGHPWSTGTKITKRYRVVTLNAENTFFECFLEWLIDDVVMASELINPSLLSCTVPIRFLTRFGVAGGIGPHYTDFVFDEYTQGDSYICHQGTGAITDFQWTVFRDSTSPVATTWVDGGTDPRITVAGNVITIDNPTLAPLPGDHNFNSNGFLYGFDDNPTRHVYASLTGLEVGASYEVVGTKKVLDARPWPARGESVMSITDCVHFNFDGREIVGDSDGFYKSDHRFTFLASAESQEIRISFGDHDNVAGAEIELMVQRIKDPFQP